jgi:hypothetical protein
MRERGVFLKKKMAGNRALFFFLLPPHAKNWDIKATEVCQAATVRVRRWITIVEKVVERGWQAFGMLLILAWRARLQAERSLHLKSRCAAS